MLSLAKTKSFHCQLPWKPEMARSVHFSELQITLQHGQLACWTHREKREAKAAQPYSSKSHFPSLLFCIPRSFNLKGKTAVTDQCLKRTKAEEVSTVLGGDRASTPWEILIPDWLLLAKPNRWTKGLDTFLRPLFYSSLLGSKPSKMVVFTLNEGRSPINTLHFPKICLMCSRQEIKNKPKWKEYFISHLHWLRRMFALFQFFRQKIYTEDTRQGTNEEYQKKKVQWLAHKGKDGGQWVEG